MSSVNGVLAIPSIASYNVSKGGINQLTRVMALALADQGVRVNAVAPGTIATELAAQRGADQRRGARRIMSRTPMKRLGEPGRGRRRGGLAGQRRGQLRHRRDRHGRRRAHDAELHRAVYETDVTQARQARIFQELFPDVSIVGTGRFGPRARTWTASTRADLPENAWTIDFATGGSGSGVINYEGKDDPEAVGDGSGPKTHGASVRLVRGGL
jgi:hypothetical protein